MENIIYNYILFLVKIITFFFIILLFFIIIINIKKYNKKLKIVNLNDQFKKEIKFILKETKIKIINNKKINNKYNNLFVIDFNGDIYANDIFELRDVISYLIDILNNNDEIMIRLNSAGGFINNYGLAAAQFERIKKKNIKLTISIDLVAASGGYLIASLGDKIIASEFSIIGSIGVIGIAPNINKFLKKYDIEIEEHTAGKYKNTLSFLGENTPEGREKFIHSLNETHTLFKNYIKKNRQKINIEDVSSGKYWYTKNALKKKLIDEIKTSDEYIKEKLVDHNVFIINKNKSNKKKNKIITLLLNLLNL
ncbi:MAG TPA: protease SohB [Candidatus Azoamicus sp.]